MNWKHTLLAALLAVNNLGIYSTAVAYNQELKTFNASFVDEYDTPIWDRLRADFRINYGASENEIKARREWYIQNAVHLETILNRSSPFLYFITEELEKRNLPAELVLIPIVESAYNPQARSSSNAAGLWQMIPSTAQDYGIEQHSAYDGRHDIYTSTNAALDYLVMLNKKFNGDWLLTIAAYNAGEGNIDKAIQQNREQGLPTDYWSLPNAKLQTRPYVQRILALADVIHNAEKYGVELPAIPNRPALVLVNLDQQIDLNRAAKIAGISLTELYAMNPGYTNRAAATTPEQGPHHLLLPIDRTRPFSKKAATFKNVAAKPEVGPVKTSVSTTAADKPHKINYRVKQGDSLYKISHLFSASIHQLLSWNNLTKSNYLKPGQILTVYVNV
jgi:membrane-bound lytic murein transglycosylase D